MVGIFDALASVQGLRKRKGLENSSAFTQRSLFGWYNSLTDAVRGDLDQFKTAFQGRFNLSDVEKLRGLSKIWKRVQKPNESVDKFVTALQKMESIYQNVSDENLRCALTLGFLPHIKRHVIESNANSLDGILQAARVAEQAAAATSEDDKSMQAALDRIEKRLINSNSQRGRFLSPIGSDDRQSRNRSSSFSRTTERSGAQSGVSTLDSYTPPTSCSPSASRNYDNRPFRQVRFQADYRQSPNTSGTSRQNNFQRGPYRNSTSSNTSTGNRGFRQSQPNNSYGNPGNSQFSGRRPYSANAATGKRCYNCGKIGHISKFCRAQRKVCYSCGMPGHLQRQCRAARPNSS